MTTGGKNTSAVSEDDPMSARGPAGQIPGISVWLVIVIIAEIGLTMAAFPTPARLASWIGLCRSARQSGTRHGKGEQKKGNSYARAAAGQAAIGAVGTATFLGERYRRIARRRGKAIAQVAVARHHDHRLAPAVRPRRRYRGLGPDFYASRISRDKKIRIHSRGLTALDVTTEDICAALGITVEDIPSGEHAA